ncbi:MAG TPA: glycogen debranching protein GlgX [Rhizobiaceae bacterium]|nr:glycogen debranching protein GlgX [Rhizobiaceae bacterium]
MQHAERRLGAEVTSGSVRFSVRSETADRIWVSIFDSAGERETDRIELARGEDFIFSVLVPGISEGTRYGFRADGEYAPTKGLWFDPDKLLVDPYAIEVDRRYVQDLKLAAPRGQGEDTAPLVPKAVVRNIEPASDRSPIFQPGGLIYEVPVRAFTKLHPDVPESERGTIRAVAHPAIIAHLKKLGVGALELMPITATIDERHLPPLGLANVWGYNPLTFMALDPRLAPGGIADLRETVAALRKEGIGVILDLVFNHTGEADVAGPTLSFRGLDNRLYYRNDRTGRLVNDTGCGNTLDCTQPAVIEMVLASLRHFVLNAGVDGFRFDLAPVLGRTDRGFDPNAPLLSAIATDPILADRVLIAEPWDVGENGYQLGNFPAKFLEWNDHYRDDIRRFWRNDRGTIGLLATRLAGSSDIFARGGQSMTRSVNFLAAHDGFTLADLSRYERKHNEANGERNRDGHSENFSWNNGVEGDSANPKIVESRRRDAFAMLATLFASRGTIMLTAGDEFGRSQCGNNNAYAQDNQITWLDWAKRDTALEAHVMALAALRAAFPALGKQDFLTGRAVDNGFPDVEWLPETGERMTEHNWQDRDRHRLTMLLASESGARLAVLINGDRRSCVFSLPARDGYAWRPAAGTERDILRNLEEGGVLIERRSVVFLKEAANT